MPNLFGIDIKAIVAQNVGQQLVAATLNKVTQGAYDPSDPGAGQQPQRVGYSCRVVATKFVKQVVEGTLVRRVKGKVTVILGTVASSQVPAPDDELVFVGPDEVQRTFTIVGDVDIDPAGATAVCEVQG